MTTQTDEAKLHEAELYAATYAPGPGHSSMYWPLMDSDTTDTTVTTLRERRDAHQALVAAGTVDTWEKDMRRDLIVARCPWWCSGRHDEISSTGLICHEGGGVLLLRLTSDENTGSGSAHLYAQQNEQGLGPVVVAVALPGNDDDVRLDDVTSVRDLGQALCRTADLLEEVLRLDAASPLSAVPSEPTDPGRGTSHE